MEKVCVVIPVYNEERHIGAVVAQTKQYIDSIIVVDDGSDDQTAHVAHEAGARVLRHIINLGKGAALKTGCRAAVEDGVEIIVTIDGDGQHAPSYIPHVVEYMKDNNLDFVFTVRRGGDETPRIRRLGTMAVNATARYLFSLKVRDIWCGFRVFRADCLSKIPWRASDYSGEIQMALQVGKSDLRYGEYVIPALYNDRFKGLHIMHGLKLLIQMIVWRILR